jgi:hypothetical protein
MKSPLAKSCGLFLFFEKEKMDIVAIGHTNSGFFIRNIFETEIQKNAPPVVALTWALDISWSNGQFVVKVPSIEETV